MSSTGEQHSARVRSGQSAAVVVFGMPVMRLDDLRRLKPLVSVVTSAANQPKTQSAHASLGTRVLAPGLACSDFTHLRFAHILGRLKHG